MRTDDMTAELARLHMRYARLLMNDTSDVSAVGQMRALLYLSEGGDGCPVGEFTRALGISTGRAANTLKQLEKKGFIRREQQTDDKRCYRVYLTDSGREHTSLIRQTADAAHRRVLERLGEADARVYLDLSGRALAAMEEARG